jgi:hypothetical protein
MFGKFDYVHMDRTYTRKNFFIKVIILWLSNKKNCHSNFSRPTLYLDSPHRKAVHLLHLASVHCMHFTLFILFYLNIYFQDLYDVLRGVELNWISHCCMDCVVKLTKAFGMQNFGGFSKWFIWFCYNIVSLKITVDDVEIPKPQIVYPQIAFENNSTQCTVQIHHEWFD